jgi:Uma2 family endonuclease
MAEVAPRRVTWEDLLATPEDGLTYEILDGELEAQPRPLPRHGRAQLFLGSELVGPFDDGRGGPGGWWIVAETDVMLGPQDIVAPDLAGWRRERMPEFPETRPVTVVPDWLCEVLSPTSGSRDRVRKAALYLRSGVPYYWLVDPEARTLEAYAAREAAWMRLGAWSDGDRPRIPPFDAIEPEVGRLFPPATPAAP